jgi:formate C-acetyltransferase
MSALAGGYRVNFLSYREPAWNPDISYDHLKPAQEKYKLHHGIGAVQHFCQDITIGFRLGWKGILANIRHFRTINLSADSQALYDGLESVVLGMQNWIGRHADAARTLAETHTCAELKQNLLEIASINERLVHELPATFRQALQWLHWFQLAAKMYNMSGSLGRLDQILYPFYQRDRLQELLQDEEAIFYLACHLINDTSYVQLGGPDETGEDTTNPLSFLVLEAAHRLKIPANIGVCVGENVNQELLRRGVNILFEDRTGIPKFLGVDQTASGFARNGYPMSLAWQRAYSGCHWSALPGREYTMNDCVKINFAAVFDVALRDLMSEVEREPTVPRLWEFFARHLAIALEVTAQGLDFHIEHMHEVFPELMLDLLCHGPIERGADASHGGVEFVNLCVDGASLATVADSFAAIEQRIEQEKKISWHELLVLLDSDWAGSDGERARQMMRSVPRYGSGDSRADRYAADIVDLFTRLVKSNKTPAGHNMIPGIFSWAAHILMGKDVGATPNGRHAFTTLSHGPNPDPGFRKDAAPTALALAVARSQCGWGNTAPMQIELDPGLTHGAEGEELVATLIKTHFQLGGTQINFNIIDREKLLAAHKNPETYPELVVRVTGFSAYFASLSPEFRQMVIDRILSNAPKP